MSEETTRNTGAPGIVFLPARGYTFDASKQTHMIKIPIEGDFEELADQELFPGEGTYKIAKDLDGNLVVSLAVLTKALFAHSKYPDLQDNECFAPLMLVISEEDISIAGKVITFVEDDTDESV